MTGYSTQLITKLRFSLLGLMLFIFVGVTTGTVMVITDDRKQEIVNAAKTMQSLAMVLSKEADSTLALADTVLSNLIKDLDLHRLDAFSDAQHIHKVLEHQHQIMQGGGEVPSFAHLFILGPDGSVVANSVTYPTPKLNAAERDFFVYHRDHPSYELHISQPDYSKITQERVIFLTKRLEDPSGTFLGIIGIHLKLRHFDHIYGSLELPPGGTVTIIRSDGWGVYRYPMAESFFKKSIQDHAGFRKMMGQRAGYLKTTKSPYDSTLRVAGFYASDKYPLLSIVTVTHDSILINWLQSAIQISIMVGVGVLFIIALAFFSYRQLGHLNYALELSSHDSLTKLRNRRAFDDRIGEEWRRAIRGAYPVSLLFVDVDFFKLYNDEYGHRTGDKCLIKIAQAMEKDFVRAGEFVARYGGEEFVVLLPNTDLSGAEKSAMHLLKAVQGLQIEHKQSSVSAYVTVSIGIASLVPVQNMNKDDLVEMADSALYAAKHAGRNQCAVYTDTD
ncbi:sensor domain-containing diguanylate cyclase [Magnetovibrio blakemorei]|uniref:sensor domain-containing diguanylate cyclase n=1 Tax=Magnetovibrio blakemorei TaxID=28181 RepID=UPI00147D7701|nr:sensor domain-containing diguanylate cyclase [Magnetovibrio blakemorei]